MIYQEINRITSNFIKMLSHRRIVANQCSTLVSDSNIHSKESFGQTVELSHIFEVRSEEEIEGHKNASLFAELCT